MRNENHLLRTASEDADEKKENAIIHDDGCEHDPIDDEMDDEMDDVSDSESDDGGSVHHVDDGDEDDGSFDFDIGDHLDRILKLFDLGERDGFPGGISSLLEKMLSPHILSSLPFADVTMDDDDLESADKARGKVIMMHGHKSGDEPMKVEKKIVDIGDDEDAIEAMADRVRIRLAAIKDLRSSTPRNVRLASIGSEAIVNDRMEFMELLGEGFDIAHRFADAGGTVDPEGISDLITCINPGEYRDSIPSASRRIVSEVISDLAMYREGEGFFRSIADRIKIAYRRIVDGDDGMFRAAYYEVRNAPAEEAEGYNPCPKFKSSGVEVPVEWTFCRDYCIEGKQQPDGKVECKFSTWLERVADSHEKAMNRLDEHRNPVNDHMQLRLPDGQKEHPKREIDTHIEAKLERSGKRGREWDDMMPKDGLAGRHMNVEALIGETLDGSKPERHDVGKDKSTEARLREAGDVKEREKTTESMLEDKRDDAAYVDGRSNEEALIAGVRPEKGFNVDKLLDELIQDAYPRDHEKRPEG